MPFIVHVNTCGWGAESSHGAYKVLFYYLSLVPRPIPSFSMVHTEKHATLKAGNGRGDEG